MNMKNNFEKFNKGGERRRKKAEDKNELSISHWQGELHSHTKTDITDPELPDDIVEYRKGSNCGNIPLEALLSYHNQEMKNKFTEFKTLCRLPVYIYLIQRL